MRHGRVCVRAQGSEGRLAHHCSIEFASDPRNRRAGPTHACVLHSTVLVCCPLHCVPVNTWRVCIAVPPPHGSEHAPKFVQGPYVHDPHADVPVHDCCWIRGVLAQAAEV